jgi:hypothetical protein
MTLRWLQDGGDTITAVESAQLRTNLRLGITRSGAAASVR